ncbi:MAG: 4-hydroxythreonine-4-phosphate dehydrogenase PdxA [Pirellulales bacterium]|nr:4-hydroxythreonine-4-phosphate dehydrogenase PdxA [Pirellulales bacterium]
MKLPTPLALTMGDPAGVGPELILRALANVELWQTTFPIVFGDAEILRRCADKLDLPRPENVLPLADWSLVATDAQRASQPVIVDHAACTAGSIVPGQLDATTGAASYAYIDSAITAALSGRVRGVVTAPISKEALHAAGYSFPGHTEIFAARCQAEPTCMLQYSPEITCAFVTTHVGYADVPALLTPQRILAVIELAGNALRKIKGTEPALVVCGLNPHAGEHGLFGNQEEERLIQPAVDQARARGWRVEGPLPPDTAFIPAKRQSTDAYICLYHDQGHIPVKALAFDSAVNTTLGLPIVRTSVDHGTANDIAWRGIANPGSLFAAIRLARRLAGE